MKSKEELVQIVAGAIGSMKSAYIEDESELAEAALKALCGALPDVHTEHKHNPDKNVLNTIAECAANYCELVKWGQNAKMQ